MKRAVEHLPAGPGAGARTRAAKQFAQQTTRLACVLSLFAAASCETVKEVLEPACEVSITTSTPSVSLEAFASTPLSASGGKTTTCGTIQRFWTSDRPEIASVSPSGVVTGVAPGSASITVTERDTEYGASARATIAVTVTTPVQVQIAAIEPELNLGAVRQLTATVTGAGGGVQWSSSAPTVVSVDASGRATAVGNGVALITATSVSTPSRSASVSITVSVRVDLSPASVTLTSGGESRQLTAFVTGSNDTRVTWSSSNPAVALVNNGLVTAVAAGTAVIKATSVAAPSISGSAPVTVETGTLPVITLSETGILERTTVDVNASPRRFTLSNDGNNVLEWTASAADSWLNTEPSSGTLQPGASATISVRFVSTALVPADYSSTITVSSTGAPAASASLTVGLKVDPPLNGVLTNRWTFSESGGAGTQLLDDIGSKHGTIVEAGPRNAIVQNGEVTLTGGRRDSSDYVALPSGLLSSRTSASIEIWATQISVKTWGRIFDIGSSTGNYLFMSWNIGQVENSNRAEWFQAGPWRLDTYTGSYTLGEQVHVVMTITSGGGQGGSTRVQLYRNGEPREFFDTNAQLSGLIDTNAFLGRSLFAEDNTANAAYNEVRIYNGALTPADVQVRYLTGPVKDK